MFNARLPTKKSRESPQIALRHTHGIEGFWSDCFSAVLAADKVQTVIALARQFEGKAGLGLTESSFELLVVVRAE